MFWSLQYPALGMGRLTVKLFFFNPAALMPGHPPVFMGVYLLSEQRRLALVAQNLV
jgi:hypothetical protein